MKIGILTLHSGANYGGTLQCVALYNILKNNGHQVDVIDFRPEIVCPFPKRLLYNITSIRSIADLLHFFHRKVDNVHRLPNKHLCHIFDEYRHRLLSFSAPCNELTIAEVSKSYDAIVVGSDQVWSSTVRSHLTYMGDWTPRFKGRLYSYAACATTTKYPIVRRWKIKRLLERFCALSVRDEFSKRFVYQFTKEKIRIDLDPTLLYSFDGMLPSRIPSEKYILVYVLGDEIDGGNKNAIERIKHLCGGAVKVVAITVYDEDVAYADETVKTASPAEWMWYIKNAQFVFTDSFHGEVFAIKFNKNFYVYYVEKNRASRIIALSHLFHLENRMITRAKEINETFQNETDAQKNEIGKSYSLSYLYNIK